MRHQLVINNKPSFGGSTFVASYEAASVKWRITARGGYDSASCVIRASLQECERIWSTMVGNVAQFYTASAVMPAWEGFIKRATLKTGGITLSRSTDNMANAVTVQFNKTNVAYSTSGNTQKTNLIENERSIAQFGIKQMTIDGGVNYGNNITHKNILRNTLLSIRSYPQISVSSNSTLSDVTLELELGGLGEYAWDWQTIDYGEDETPVTAAFAFALVTTNRTNANNGVFPENAKNIYETVNSGAFSLNHPANALIVGNNAFTIAVEERGGKTYKQFIDSIVEAGNGSQQFVYGITAASPFEPRRWVYYRPARIKIVYGVRTRYDAGKLRTLTGQIVPSDQVTADAGVQLMDALAAWSYNDEDASISYNSGWGDDPRISYIESVEYDGDSYTATWASGDNITLEGAFMEDRLYKHYRNRFGAKLRQSL